MPSPSDITVVFVPGAFHSPEVFDLVADKLRAKGFNVDYVRLASVGATLPIESVQPDIDVIHKHIAKAVDASQHVVTVSHSYGGVPTSDAVHGFDYTTRQAAGLPGGVIHMFYCCSFLVPVGQTLMEAYGGGEADWYGFSEDGKEMHSLKGAWQFYNDLPEDVAEHWVGKLKPSSTMAFTGKVQYGMWQKVPTTYLYCLQDNAIPYPRQQQMVNEWARAAGATIRTETIDAGHSPFLSKPDETAAAIERAAMLEV